MNARNVVDITNLICKKLEIHESENQARIAAAVIISEGLQCVSDVGPALEKIAVELRDLSYAVKSVHNG